MSHPNPIAMRIFSKTKIFLCSLFITFVTFPAFGQVTPERRATAMTDWMRDNLKLSAEQEKPVHTINLKYAHIHDDICASTSIQEERIKSWEASSRAKKKELRKVLNDEQYSDYETMEEAIRQKFKEEEKQKKKP